MPFAPVLQAHTNLLYNVAKDDAKKPTKCFTHEVCFEQKYALYFLKTCYNKEWNCW